ncbi:hypothetical protein Patl1_15426 [Pistacia atlantica]|uniref:Uncharacterized protein n=1 Tax=Pistacia atlantica TaxID=434234 RepID=A0ACC1B9X4_9ROSI|nr:hypothetical protein Patl1_15426 [Pistacia atlantica]
MFLLRSSTKLWKFECFHFPTASPSNIQGVEVHEGDWETGDSIKIWTYTVEGRAKTFKEKVEADDEHMTITLHDIEGDIFKNFKFWKPVFKVAPKQEGSGSVVTVSIEYKKRNKDIPYCHIKESLFCSLVYALQFLFLLVL